MKLKLFLILFLFQSLSFAQVLAPAKWKYTSSKQEVKIGETIELIFTVVLDKDWHLYSTDFDPNLGPLLTIFTYTPHSSYELVGKVKPIGSKKKFDEIWGGDVTYFENTAEFRQTIKILQKEPKIQGEYSYQVCTEGKCINGSGEFELANIKVLASANTKMDEVKKKFKERTTDTQSGSLFAFILLAIGAGIISLLTPCVFPMIPMTVTFFTNTSISRPQAIKKALLYGISIVVVYTLIGLLLARFNGPDFANFLSTHWIPNIAFFLIFFIFALSFLGMFDITLPNSFVNKIDAQSERKGLIGVFFMALTLVLVSFSCTGPIVGSLLVEAAGGKAIKPILGMLAYSISFAVPFTLFALFPSWLNKLPKSGGWLNVIKVILGFIELALSLKFLSIADQVYHWNILDREIYIALWMVIFICMGIYLLGKIRLPHDSETHVTSVPRLLLAIASFTFAAYLLPGMFGAPLKALSGYLPPISTIDFDIPGIIRENNLSNESGRVTLCEEPKFGKKLKLPHGLKGYFDYQQALKCAREKKLPIFIDFTGHGCTNCREMEANVWSDTDVLKILNKDYVIVALYVDDKTPLLPSEIYTSTRENRTIKTIGGLNSDLQITKFDNNAQPFYVLLDPFTEKLLAQPIGYESSILNFIDFLEEGKNNFKGPEND